jgi:4-aminobutyrate aminotransferase
MANKINLITGLPGPKSKALIEEEKKYISRSYTRDENYPLTVKEAQGMWVTDLDGNTFLDFTAGIATCSTGHCHPKVLEAIITQAKKLIHMSGTDFYYESQVYLAKKLNDISPGNTRKNVFLSNSGTEANEAAIKLAKYHTKRYQLISFYGSFHGRSTGSLALTASKVTQKKRFFPLMPGVTYTYYANCYRCPFNLNCATCNCECAKYIEDYLFKSVVPADEVAAIFIEPIQGEGGYVVPPKKFIDEISKLAKKYEILIVADEIQCGMGRTGKMFASSHFDLIPDILTGAKGIASGMPLGATIAPETIMNWTPGTHASTFGGNPIACSASLATIELLEKELITNAHNIGEYIIEQLKKLENKYEFIGDIRGKGLMIGIEIVKDKLSKIRDKALRDKIIYACLAKGFLILPCGENTIRFCPPLIVNKEEANIALEIFNDVLKKIK